MRKFLNQVSLMIIFIGLAFFTSSCGKDDEPSGGKSKGEWYVAPNGFAKASDFDELNEAIDNHEILTQYRNNTHYAEVDEFIEYEGGFSDTSASVGRFRFNFKICVRVIHIIDEMTVERYITWLYLDQGPTLYVSGRGELQRIWQFDAGRHFGKMSYYDKPSIQVYIQNGNTLVFDDGDVFIKTSEGLKGNDGLWTKFKPTF